MNKQAGKGDKPRPVNKERFDENFEQIKWNNVKSSTKEVSNKKGKLTYRY